VAPADFAEIAAQLLADLEPVAHGRVSLRAVGSLAGQWDVDRILQAVTNLLGNALQHGADSCAIELSLDGSDERTVRVTVHNEGAIPAEIRDILFSPFKPRRSGTGGLGLGLFIVEQIVRGHGGNITVMSSEARGTTFEITLPRTAVSWSPQRAAVGG
jgi:signal transduction histidine kinase